MNNLQDLKIDRHMVQQDLLPFFPCVHRISQSGNRYVIDQLILQSAPVFRRNISEC